MMGTELAVIRDHRLRRSASGVVGVGLGLVLLLPVAVQGDERQSPELTGFRLQASNGYRLSVVAGTSSVEERDWIWLLLRGRRAVVSYVAPATVSSGAIHADLGKLGKISVTRVPTGRTKTVRRSCKPESRKRVGAERYEGTIEFHGEEGFAEVSAVRAPLVRSPWCWRGREGGSPRRKRLRGARLDVEKHSRGNDRLEFDATQRRSGAKTRLSMEVDEHRGEIDIQRAIWTWGRSGALRYDRRLRTAIIRPPAPFAGHGIFRRNVRRAKQWTGNLTVDLPGRSDVPLTGRGFFASLEHRYR